MAYWQLRDSYLATSGYYSTELCLLYLQTYGEIMVR